jgi:hypothetical protein
VWEGPILRDMQGGRGEAGVRQEEEGIEMTVQVQGGLSATVLQAAAESAAAGTGSTDNAQRLHDEASANVASGGAGEETETEGEADIEEADGRDGDRETLLQGRRHAA